MNNDQCGTFGAFAWRAGVAFQRAERHPLFLQPEVEMILSRSVAFLPFVYACVFAVVPATARGPPPLPGWAGPPHPAEAGTASLPGL